MKSSMLNADFSLRCVLDSNALPWETAASPSVQRKLLESSGGVGARTTSIVRYAPGAAYDSPLPEAGGEILVLEGSFSDAFGSHKPGTYLKSPSGSGQAFLSVSGCTLLLKLGHLEPADTERVVVDTVRAPWFRGAVEGLTVLPLAEFGTSHTALVRWAPGTLFKPHRHFGGEEIFVVEGVFSDEHGRYPQGSWIRSPHLSLHTPFSEEGCLIFVKTGHLPN
ncbi:MAG: cupin [Verrucomicrobia bacterium]|nr:cupin [Verrucomicrobiota bacterium]